MRLCSGALLLAVAAGAQAAAEPRVEAAWIVSKLARPAPMRTSFVEIRTSRLLKTPLRLSGEYLRPDGDRDLPNDIFPPGPSLR